MKTDTERGQIGAWARRSRMAAGLSVEQAVARLAQAGTAADASYIRAIESGAKRPRPDSDIVVALAGAYRVEVPGDRPAPSKEEPGSMGTLLRLMADQVAAINGLVMELRAERDERKRLADRLSEVQAQVDELLAAREADAEEARLSEAPSSDDEDAPPRGPAGPDDQAPEARQGTRSTPTSSPGPRGSA